MRGRLASSIVFAILLIVWSVAPILWNFVSSLKTRTVLFSYPPKFLFEPNLDAYGRALSIGTRESIFREATNSLIIAIGATLITVTLSTLAAYAFARLHFPGRNVILGSLLVARLLPPISVVVPVFLLASRANLIDTHILLIVVYSGLSVPLAVWLLKAFIESIPVELEESARTEGATTLGAIRLVVLPLLRPGLIVSVAFVFVQCWNEFMFAYMFTSVDARTLPLKLGEIRGEDQVFWQDMSAQATLYILPALVLGFYLQRHLVHGLSAGSIK